MLQALYSEQIGQHGSLRRAAGSSGLLVQRLELARQLEGHQGCVNTISFSPDGTILASGSDDLKVILWDWQTGVQRCSLDTGHTNNVFQAKFMPNHANKTIVTAAADGQIRLAQLSEAGGVATRRLARHRGRAHKLALLPGSAHCLLTSGEDGVVHQIDLREPSGHRRLLVCTSTGGYPLELNSVHCHPWKPQFCVGGGDPFLRVYDLRKPLASHLPVAMPLRRLAPHSLASGRRRSSLTHITCAVYSSSDVPDLLASYNDEHAYLFAAEERQGMAASSAGRSAGCVGARQAPARSSGKRVRSSDDASASGGRRSVRHVGRGGAQSRQPAGDATGRRSSTAAAAAAHARVRQSLLADDGMGPGQPLAGACTAPGNAAAAAEAATAGCSSRAVDGRGTLPQQAAQPASASPAGSNSGGTRAASQDGSRQGSSSTSDAARGPSSSSNSSSTSEGEEEDVARVQLLEQMEAAMAGHGSETSSSEDGEARMGSDSDVLPGESSSEEGGEEEEEGQELLDRASTGGVLLDSLEDDSSREEAAPGSDGVLQCYKGHRNAQTVKGCSFFGDQDQYVLSGSDCGSVFIYDRHSGGLRMLLEDADRHVVNCLEPSPTHSFCLCTSGIDDTIKVWTPTAAVRRPPGTEAERRMQRNLREQGSRATGITITPHMLRMLLLRGQPGAGSDEEDSDGGPQPSDCLVS